MPDSRPCPSLARDLLAGGALLACATLFFRLTPADISWANPWRDGSDWLHGDEMPWSLLYHLGTYPALIVVLTAVVVLLVGFRLAPWARFRRHALFLVLVLAIGPGLITNAILKDHWGRPRPRDVAELGGLWPYEPLLTIDPLSPGKSFPCGHATMGFFFVTGYFLLRARHPVQARIALVAALAFGVAIGWARVVQGGHFPSDVAWAAGVLWMVSAVMARVLRVDLVPEAMPDFRPVPWPRLSISLLLVPTVVFLGLMATPLDRKEHLTVSNPPAGPYELRLQVPMGDTTLDAGKALEIRAQSHGFGLPGGGLKAVWKEPEASEDAPRYEFKQRVSGLHTEINQTLHATIPVDSTVRVHVTQSSGTVRVKLPSVAPASPPRKWIIELTDGEVDISPGPLPYRIKNGDKREGPADAPDEIELRLGPGVNCRIAR